MLYLDTNGNPKDIPQGKELFVTNDGRIWTLDDNDNAVPVYNSDKSVADKYAADNGVLSNYRAR